MAQTNYPHQWKAFPAGPDFFDFWEDWADEYTGQTTSAAAGNRWINTLLSSGTFAQTTDEKFGVAVLSGAATTDNSGAQIQADMETCSLVTSKTTRFMVRLKLNEITENEFAAGLSITDTTMLDGVGTLAAGLTPTDFVGFYKPDGAADVYCVVRRDSVNVVAFSVGAVVADTYAVWAFEVVMSSTAGTGTIRAAKDGNWVQQSGGAYSTVMPYDSEEILTPAVAFVTGDNVSTKTCTVDYLGVLQER
jgi:hypothetical protein